MLNTMDKLAKREAAFVDDYRQLQRTVSRMRGEPLPPCCYCATSKIWNCSNTGQECSVFTRYCSDIDKHEDK